MGIPTFGAVVPTDASCSEGPPQAFFRRQSFCNFYSFHRQKGGRRSVTNNAIRFLKIEIIVATSTPTQCKRHRKRLSSSPSPTDPLLVVKTHGRHVGQKDRLKRA